MKQLENCLYCGCILNQPKKGRKKKFCNRNCQRMANYYLKKDKRMFGIFKKKAKAAQIQLHKVENRDLMEAIVAGSILVAFADGDCSSDELQKLGDVISANDNLAHFGSEIGKTIDKYSAMYEAGSRLAKVKLMKEIGDIEDDEDQKIEAFIIAIEVADADGEIDEKELAVLKEIGKKLGLNPESYI